MQHIDYLFCDKCDGINNLNCNDCNIKIDKFAIYSCDICHGFIHKKCGKKKYKNHSLICKQCVISIETKNIYDALTECLYNISNKILSMIADYVQIIAIHKNPLNHKCWSQTTIKCPICKCNYCIKCIPIIQPNDHRAVKQQLCIIRDNNGCLKCNQCILKKSIIKSCYHCHEEIHFDSKLHLLNDVNRDGNHVYLHRGRSKYNIVSSDYLFCDKCDGINKLKCCECKYKIDKYSIYSCDICHQFIHKKCGIKTCKNYSLICKHCETENIYKALIKSRNKHQYLVSISNKILSTIAEYVQIIAIHKTPLDPKCHSQTTIKCDICGRIYCKDCCEINADLQEKGGLNEAWPYIIKDINGYYKCQLCISKKNIIRYCHYCHQKHHFNSELDLIIGINKDGQYTKQYNGVSGTQGTVLLCINRYCDDWQYRPNCIVCDRKIYSKRSIICVVCNQKVFMDGECGKRLRNYNKNAQSCVKSTCVAINGIYNILRKVRHRVKYISAHVQMIY